MSSPQEAGAPTEDEVATSPRDVARHGIFDQRPEDELQQQEDESAPVEMDEQATLSLLATAKDQEDVERDLERQADTLLTAQADERDQKRLDKTCSALKRLQAQLRKVDQKLAVPGGSRTTTLLLAEKSKLEADTETAELEVLQIRARMAERHADLVQAEENRQDAAGEGQRPGESRREFLIRTGKITPFSKMPGLQKMSSNLADVMLEAEAQADDGEHDEDEADADAGPRSHQVLRRPGFADAETPEVSSAGEMTPRKTGKKRKLVVRKTRDDDDDDIEDEDAFDPDEHEARLSELGVSESESDAEAALAMASEPTRKRKRGAKAAKARRRQDSEDEVNGDLTLLDDGNEQAYQARVQRWARKRKAARQRAQETRDETTVVTADVLQDDETVEEWHQPHPTHADTTFEGGFRIPGDIYPSLYDYQKTGVRWLWELYSQQVGGIVGDEMGLGKTIQIIAFIAGLHYSKMLTQPVIVVCPATVMKQWSNEFHTWWPALRVSILHSSGSGMMDVRREEEIEDELDYEDFDAQLRKPKNHSAAKRIVDRVVKAGHILVTTYSGLQTYSSLLINVDWGYAVLDEGHKIRNPNTAITIHAKQLRTANRIILSGTPIQNNLTELWSLFDFVFPMRLGTLVSFRTQFETPIRIGGYANASNLQVETAIRCAEALKETISPYLLQRWKVDVASDLPKKTERVLFCELTALQRQHYQIFLDSEEMKSILAGKRHSLYGIDILRKISNHPDLVDHKRSSGKSGYGDPSKSGKMRVVRGLLEMWKRAGHKTLLFAQHRIMLDIMEKFVRTLSGIKYRRMDGNTSIKERQDLVDEFNNDPSIDVFLLTTKVGGLGVNLTGANRVIIYDPDWNPSTDIQARERAWRLGQKREVEIYRLMTAGTIEEKIYHRQVFKQILTNKVLRDPKQRQTFHLRELHDLFTLGDKDGNTETGSLFKGTELKLPTKANLPTPPGDGEAERDEEGMTSLKGLAREEEYAGEDPKAKPLPPPGDEGGEDRILSAIFSKSGVHSAHEHEAIIAGSALKPKVTADPEMITREARRVAAIAARELQRAGEAARNVPIGVPTWTGTHGSTGRPEERPRVMPVGRGAGRGRGGGGPSSSSILGNLAARQTAGSSASSRISSPASGTQPRGKYFMVLIRDYLRAHGNSVYTQMLIDHFNRYCGTEQRTAEFKEMLSKIAKLEKGRGGRGRWSLKEEYRA